MMNPKQRQRDLIVAARPLAHKRHPCIATHIGSAGAVEFVNEATRFWAVTALKAAGTGHGLESFLGRKGCPLESAPAGISSLCGWD
jgi:hypothetical protein